LQGGQIAMDVRNDQNTHSALLLLGALIIAPDTRYEKPRVV